MDDRNRPPILRDKRHEEPSAFQPEGLLREARRQKDIDISPVPEFCLLDPDGDIVRHLLREGRAERIETWACYHSDMYRFDAAGHDIGIVGCAVGAPYAVLLAEQMFASGCRFLLSITSSGQLAPLGPRPYYVVLDRALRDEGTSYHYLPASDFADADAKLIERVCQEVAGTGPAVYRGGAWTTDAPFRETEHVLEQGRALGLAAIEMETAALYALACARSFPIVCIAHVTNVMATTEGDFEKGEEAGAVDALKIVAAVAAGFDRILEGIGRG